MSLPKFFIPRGSVFIILSALCYSTTGTAQAFAPDGASPYLIGSMRLVVGALAMLALCFFSKQLPSLKHFPPLRTLLAALGIFGYQISFFAALKLTGVATGTVIAIGSSPIAAGILAFIFLKERPVRIWYPATIIAIAGLALLSLTKEASVNLYGLLLAVVAGFSYAVYSVAGKSINAKNSPSAIIAVLFSTAAILSVPMFFIYPTSWIFTGKGMAVSLHLGIITAALGYVFNLTGLRLTPIATAATLSLLEPLAAALLGIFLLKEPYSEQLILGMVLIFASTVLLARPSRN